MHIIAILIKSSFKFFAVASISSVLTGLSSAILIKTIHSAVQKNELDTKTFILEFLIFWIGYGILSILSSFSVSKLSQKVIHQLRIDLSNKFLSAPFEEIERKQSRLLPVLTEDIKTISYSIDRLPGVVTGLATVIGILIYMIWYSPKLSLATIIMFLAVYLSTKTLLPVIKKYADFSRSYINNLYKLFEGLVYGIKELAINEKLKNSYLEDQIVPVSLKQTNYFLKENVINAVSNRATDMILLFGMGLLVILINQLHFVTLVFFGEFLTLVLFIVAPLATAVGFLGSLKRIEVAMKHIEETGISLKEEKLNDNIIENSNWKSDQPLISISGISHAYYHSEEDEEFQIGPISFDIRNGETLFIVGGNGSGKTTLAKIIVGLYKSNHGMITYKNKELTKSNLKFYRSQFSAIFTDSYLFDNLDHIDKDILESEGPQLIELMNLSKKVHIKDQKFSTIRLSEGQRKRLSLVISILEDKSVYLFDEWAANQDPHFKEIFYHKILTYLKDRGKTLIVITHDDNYFHLADGIIKLRDGQQEF